MGSAARKGAGQARVVLLEQEAKALFDVDADGMVTMLETRSVMRSLLPKLHLDLAWF